MTQSVNLYLNWYTFINIQIVQKNYIKNLSSYLVIITTIIIFFISSLFVCNPFLSAQYSEGAASSNQTAAQPGLSELGTRFEAVGGIMSLPSQDCLGCAFRGIVEKVSEAQYSIRGEVVADNTSIIIPISVLGTVNIDGSAINGTLIISDEQYNIEGTSTTYSPTCSYCKQTLDLRGQSIQGDDVMSANIPLNSIN